MTGHEKPAKVRGAARKTMASIEEKAESRAETTKKKKIQGAATKKHVKAMLKSKTFF